MPLTSDQSFRLAKNLSSLARYDRTDISLPAGTVLISITALEAYVNERADMALNNVDRCDFDALRDNLLNDYQFLSARVKAPDDSDQT